MTTFKYNFVINIIMEFSIFITEVRDNIVKRKKEIFTWGQLKDELKSIGDFSNNSFVVISAFNDYIISHSLKTEKGISRAITMLKDKIAKVSSNRDIYQLLDDYEPYQLEYNISFNEVNKWLNK